MSSSFLSQPILLTASETSVFGCSAERKKEGKGVGGGGWGETEGPWEL